MGVTILKVITVVSLFINICHIIQPLYIYLGSAYQGYKKNTSLQFNRIEVANPWPKIK